jgi:hypothetical protein
VAVVYNKDGIKIGSAEASCLRSEPNWAIKPEFQLKSMAQTRAGAKALRNLYGWVAVLAGVKPTPVEEITDEPFNGNEFSKPPATDLQSRIEKAKNYNKK